MYLADNDIMFAVQHGSYREYVVKYLDWSHQIQFEKIFEEVYHQWIMTGIVVHMAS